MTTAPGRQSETERPTMNEAGSKGPTPMAKKRSSMTDSRFDRMIVEEKLRWLESRGAAGGSFAEFSAHIRALIETDKSWLLNAQTA